MMDHRIIAQLCVMHGSQKDDRIRVIHKKKLAASVLLEMLEWRKMTGKYVCFIDSDDWVETNTFEVLLEHFEKSIRKCKSQLAMRKLSVERRAMCNRMKKKSGYMIRIKCWISSSVFMAKRVILLFGIK